MIGEDGDPAADRDDLADALDGERRPVIDSRDACAGRRCARHPRPARRAPWRRYRTPRFRRSSPACPGVSSACRRCGATARDLHAHRVGGAAWRPRGPGASTGASVRIRPRRPSRRRAEQRSRGTRQRCDAAAIKQLARDRTSAPLVFPARLHAVARGRALAAISRIEARELDADPRQLDLELFGDEHRERGGRALSHLAANRCDRDRIVVADADDRSELGRPELDARRRCTTAQIPRGESPPAAAPITRKPRRLSITLGLGAPRA